MTPHTVSQVVVGKEMFLSTPTQTATRASLPQSVGGIMSSVEPLFNEAELLQRTGGDVALAAEILAMCPGELTKMLNELETGVAQKDADQISRAAHRLKGTLGNIGAVRAFEAALLLEDLANQGDLAHVEEQFRLVRIDVERLRLAVAATCNT